MIAKARKEITNLAEVETTEMTIAGKSTIENTFAPNEYYFLDADGNKLNLTNSKFTKVGYINGIRY